MKKILQQWPYNLSLPVGMHVMRIFDFCEERHENNSGTQVKKKNMGK